MKVAVSSAGEGKGSRLSPVFGRCPFFVVVDTESGEEKSVKNTAAGQMGGAGMTAGQLIGNEGASAVITMAMGPRAFTVMQQLGIAVYEGKEGTVEENVELLKKKMLRKMEEASGPLAPGGGRPMGPGRGSGGGRE